MRSLTARVAVLSAALLGLTGCWALPTPHAFTDRVDAVADSAPAPAGAVRLSAGKRYGSFEEPMDVSVTYALAPPGTPPRAAARWSPSSRTPAGRSTSTTTA